MQVIETHVIVGEVDAGSVQDGDTATTISGETIVFSRGDDGQVSAAVEGGADSVVLGERQNSCSGPIYIVDKPLRPKAIAPAVAPMEAPAPAPVAPAPAPEAPAPAPEAPAPAPQAPAPVEVPTPAPAMIAPREFIIPVEGPMEMPVEAPMEVPMEAPMLAPVVAVPIAAPMVAPALAPVEVPALAPVEVPAAAPIVPLIPLVAPVAAPIVAALPREFILPMAPAPGPADCMTLADSLRQINPALLEAALVRSNSPAPLPHAVM